LNSVRFTASRAMLILVLAAFVLAACSSAAASVPATASPTPELQPTGTVFSAGVYHPLASQDCEALQSGVNQALSVNGTMTEAPFDDLITKESGSGCQITVTGSGASFKNLLETAGNLKSMLTTAGWSEDQSYAADSPNETVMAFRQGSALLIVDAGWLPAPEAGCPTDQPIDSCELSPEQQLFVFTVNAAKK
jgi:hypothetical protein